MCRLFGYISKSGDETLYKNFDFLLRLMQRGGPDFHGTYLTDDKKVGLGHRRLSILDLEHRSNQPFWDDSLRYCMLFNGEIYNYRELRSELEKSGHKFRTNSDTEVLLKGFLSEGNHFLNKCHGMWAFALFDKETRKVVLIRDRYGVKPLYFYESSDYFIFSSEFKVFSALETHLNLKISPQSLNEYFEYGYVSAPNTLYSEIKKVMPGEYVEFESFESTGATGRWYQRELHKSTLSHRTHLQGELEDAIKRSISLRLVSDVPIAMFLSGGVDSNLVAAMVASLGVKLETFSIAFHPNQFDETLFASKSAEYFGHRFNRIVLGPDDVADIFNDFDLDEPVCDISFVPTYLLSKVAAGSFKVALSGDGGDELFGGYTNYKKVEQLSSLLNNLKSFNFPLSNRLKEEVDFLLPSKMSKTNLKFDFSELFHSSRRFIPTSIVQRLVDGGQQTKFEQNVESIEDMLEFDFTHFMVDDVLSKVDRCSMQAALEVREPLLDQNIVHIANSMSIDYKFHDSFGKYPLRKILEKYMPNSLYNNPKRGLGIPYKSWIRDGKLDWFDFVRENIGLLNDLPINQKSLSCLLKGRLTSSDLKSNIVLSLFFLVKWRQFNRSNDICMGDK